MNVTFSPLRAFKKATLALGLSAIVAAAGAQTVTAVLHAPLRGLDPVMGTPYMFRNYGYMVYDTLLALDADNKVQPQMADWKVSADGKTYAFTLRDGLKWHDGKPVTADDCVASIKRWMQYDKLGALMADALADSKVTGEKTFELSFKQPTQIVLQALSKPSGVAPFMMPKAVIDAADGKQITATIGSGPFKFVAGDYKPGVQAVFVKNTDYVPRKEPASGLAGGKVVKVDKVRWVVMPDTMTAVNALQSGEIDMIEMMPHDMLPMIEGNSDLYYSAYRKQAFQNMARLNFVQPPFNNLKIRQAAMLALGQKQVLEAQSGNPKLFRVCAAAFGCDSPYASNFGADKYGKAQPDKAKALLKEAGYDNAPIVLLNATDTPNVATMSTVIAEQLKAGGFNVQMVNSDIGAWIARRLSKAAPSAGGWNIFATSNVLPEVSNPLGFAPVSAAGEKAYLGWPDIPSIEQTRAALAAAPSEADRKKIAAQLDREVIEQVLYIPLGEFDAITAKRKSIQNQLDAPAPVFWNLTKTGK